jgi:hypothetical protein
MASHSSHLTPMEKLDRRKTKNRQWQVIARQAVMNSCEERIQHKPGGRVPIWHSSGCLPSGPASTLPAP